MPLEVFFQHERRHLVATVGGRWAPTAITAGLTLIRNTARQTAYSRILIDASTLSPPRVDFYRFLAGQDLAALFPLPCKVAVVCQAKWITKFAENVAVNRGARVLVCADRVEALGWLLEERAIQATRSDKA